jgi:putative two-component system response regulator
LPIFSGILAVIRPRAYEAPYDNETTCRIITEGDGRTLPEHFDPEVLMVFHEMTTRCEEVHEEMRN